MSNYFVACSTSALGLLGRLTITGIAFYQADSVAKTFSTFGFLVPIITVLAIAIMPRAKFLQTMMLNTLGICIGSAVSLLGIWSGVKAREHTTPAGSTATYNSSQAALVYPIIPHERSLTDTL